MSMLWRCAGLLLLAAVLLALMAGCAAQTQTDRQAHLPGLSFSPAAAVEGLPAIVNAGPVVPNDNPNRPGTIRLVPTHFDTGPRTQRGGPALEVETPVT